MHTDFHDIFASPGGEIPLKFDGDLDYGRWGNGELVDDSGELSYGVADGIPHVAGAEADPWGDDKQVQEHLKRLHSTREKVIEANYDNMVNSWPPKPDFIEQLTEIANGEGRVLEVACGPGGGFSPLLVEANPDVSLLMVDLGLWLLDEWQKLGRKKKWSRLSLAQADPTRLPIRTETFSAVVNFGGMSNLPTQLDALKEAHRVLKPGGKLFMIDARPDPSGFRKLPSEEKERLSAKFPNIGKSVDQTLNEAGFFHGSFEETGRRPLPPGTVNAPQRRGHGRRTKGGMDVVFCRVLAFK
jgi:ubiquinone/menaquinone biosynthesis C-methylase UbiE